MAKLSGTDYVVHAWYTGDARDWRFEIHSKLLKRLGDGRRHNDLSPERE